MGSGLAWGRGARFNGSNQPHGFRNVGHGAGDLSRGECEDGSDAAGGHGVCGERPVGSSAVECGRVSEVGGAWASAGHFVSVDAKGDSSPDGIQPRILVADCWSQSTCRICPDGTLEKRHRSSSNPSRHVLQIVGEHLNDFVQFPKRALLLWQDCDRKKPPGEKQRYHQYPVMIRELAKRKAGSSWIREQMVLQGLHFSLPVGFVLRDMAARMIGLHITCTQANSRYLNRVATTHAVKFGCHFTQSAGVITAHPIADAMCDEFPFFAWLLRAESFRRSGYLSRWLVFSVSQGELGFATGFTSEVIFASS